MENGNGVKAKAVFEYTNMILSTFASPLILPRRESGDKEQTNKRNCYTVKNMQIMQKVTLD